MGASASVIPIGDEETMELVPDFTVTGSEVKLMASLISERNGKVSTSNLAHYLHSQGLEADEDEINAMINMLPSTWVTDGADDDNFSSEDEHVNRLRDTSHPFFNRKLSGSVPADIHNSTASAVYIPKTPVQVDPNEENISCGEDEVGHRIDESHPFSHLAIKRKASPETTAPITPSPNITSPPPSATTPAEHNVTPTHGVDINKITQAAVNDDHDDDDDDKAFNEYYERYRRLEGFVWKGFLNRCFIAANLAIQQHMLQLSAIEERESYVLIAIPALALFDLMLVPVGEHLDLHGIDDHFDFVKFGEDAVVSVESCPGEWREPLTYMLDARMDLYHSEEGDDSLRKRIKLALSADPHEANGAHDLQSDGPVNRIRGKLYNAAMSITQTRQFNDTFENVIDNVCKKNSSKSRLKEDKKKRR